MVILIKSRLPALLVTGILLAGVVSACQPGDSTRLTGGESENSMSKLITANDLIEAVRIAESAFSDAQAKPEEYTLVNAERLLTGDPNCIGARCWKLTFKLNRLVPTVLPARIGAGGELFFIVDLDAAKAVLTGRGE